MIFEIVGWMAAILTGLQFFPQVVRTYMRRSARDLSFLTFSMLAFTAVLWIVYGSSQSDYVIITANVMIFACGVSLISMKLLFRH